MSPESMTCAQLETLFDEYVDETLDPSMAEVVSAHLACCRNCDREVSRWQQTRILLSTAVTDLATAVDVSSLRSDVISALGLSDQAAPRLSETREASFERGADARRRAGKAGRRTAGASRRSGFAAAWRFASAATVSAITAAAAVVLLSPSPQTDGTMVASPVRVTSSSYQPVSFKPGGKRLFNEVKPAAYSRPPLARPEVSHVDGLEAAPGHLVSTWVQPRTNARVIWVQERGLGAPVRTAGLDR